MSKRNYALDVMKLLLSYVVAFFHLGITLPPTPAVAVEIFFILSGFFLARKFYSRSYENPERYTAWDYTVDHAKSVYPHYLLSLAVFFLYLLARSALFLVLQPSAEGTVQIFRDFYNQIPDLLLLQSSYRFHESINYPAWQISALLIGGYFVYALLCRDEKLARRILFPAAILMVQSLLYAGVDLFENYGFFYLPLLRAFSGLSIGVLTWYALQTGRAEAIHQHPLAMNLGTLFCIAGLLTFCGEGGIHLVTVPFLILAAASPACWLTRSLNRPIFRKCGSLSLAVYLNHSLIERIVKSQLLPRFPMNDWQLAVVYFVFLTAYSLITLALVERWTASRRTPAAV